MVAVVRCKIEEVGRGQISECLCVMPTTDGEHSEQWFEARIKGKRLGYGGQLVAQMRDEANR